MAMASGVARKPITDMAAYKLTLSARLDPLAASLQAVSNAVSAHPQQVVFAEGESEKAIRAAIAFRNAGYGRPILIGVVERIEETARANGLGSLEGIDINNAGLSIHNKAYTDHVYSRLQRKGYLYRDCQRLVNQDRNVFAASMVRAGHADAIVTGLTRTHAVLVDDILKVIDTFPDQRVFGMTMMLAKGRTVFIADTTIHERPTSEELADIAIGAARKVRELGHEPRVALLSYSSFGSPEGDDITRIRNAVKILESRQVDFEFEGEMGADVALDAEFLKVYPFSRLSGPANILITPGQHAANISYKLLHKLGGATVIGPMLIGLSVPVQIVHLDASVADLVTMALFAAHEAIHR